MRKREGHFWEDQGDAGKKGNPLLSVVLLLDCLDEITIHIIRGEVSPCSSIYRIACLRVYVYRDDTNNKTGDFLKLSVHFLSQLAIIFPLSVKQHDGCSLLLQI